jgi:hypothetical protein
MAAYCKQHCSHPNIAAAWECSSRIVQSAYVLVSATQADMRERATIVQYVHQIYRYNKIDIKLQGGLTKSI